MTQTIEKTTYTIKEFAQKMNLAPSTLRYYEKEGLLPATRRRDNGHRVYSDSDIPWVTIISCLRSTGMSVSDLRHYVELCEQGEKTVQARRQIILSQKEKLEAQLQEVKNHLKTINMKLNLYDEIISKQTPSSASLPVVHGAFKPVDCTE